MSDKKELSFSISVEGVSNEAAEMAKLETQLRNLTKERNAYLKTGQANNALNAEAQLKLAAYNRGIEEHKSRLQTLKRVLDTASDSLARKKALLIEMTKQSDAASKEIQDKMAPAILRLNNEIKAGENARGVFARNVGNYPGMLKEAAGGFNDIARSAGGATGEIGSFASSLLTAGGPIGIITVAVGGLAAAWKKAQENIKSYLESADKLELGEAGFDAEAEEARVDVRKRANGMIAEGYRIEKENMAKLTTFSIFYTEEQKKHFALLASQGKQMQEQGRMMRDEVKGVRDKAEWTIKYNKLLQEQERISDEKFINETRWEEFEANLIKQRAIVSDQESSIAEKKQAANDADIIAGMLLKEKTQFIDRELQNMNAIAEMTSKQEVFEDKINGLLKERNSIQKEYYSDQVKINRLQRSANRGNNKSESADNFDSDSLWKSTENALKFTAPETGGDIPAEVEAEKQKQDLLDQAWEEGMQKAREHYAKMKADAKNDFEERMALQLDELDQQRILSEAKIDIAYGLANTLHALSGKNKAMSLAALGIEKASAVAQVISNIGAANGKAIAMSPLTAGQPWVTINTALGGVQIARIIAETGRSIKEISKYEYGGRITDGIPVYIPGSKDDRLIAVNGTETVLTERQVASLGGQRTMRALGIRGFEQGGYTGQYAPSIPPAVGLSIDYERMAEIMKNSIEVTLNTHKVISAIREVEVATTHQRI